MFVGTWLPLIYEPHNAHQRDSETKKETSECLHVNIYMKNSIAASVFTWFIILRCAEVERGLGALQAHLSPVCDSLQFHSVTAVLLQSLQIHPALSLQPEKHF